MIDTGLGDSDVKTYLGHSPKTVATDPLVHEFGIFLLLI
jgi:hypothetical protein